MQEIDAARQRMRRRDRGKFDVLLRHSHFLRSSLRLTINRNQQFDQICLRLGYSEMPTGFDDMRKMEMETKKEANFIFERINLSSSYEIMKFYCGPLQIALCLAYAMKSRYNELSRNNSLFQDEKLDGHFNKNPDFFQKLKGTRDSLLHERYDNIYKQADFLINVALKENVLDVLLEYADAYEAYLLRLSFSLSENGNG